MRVRISPGARKVNQTGVRASLLRNARLTAVGFEYPAFLVKKRIRIRFLTWIAGYVLIGAILVALEAVMGHNQWTAWSYITFGYIIAWVTASITGLFKGWFY